MSWLAKLRATSEAHFTPVAWRSDSGVFVGHDGAAWLYRVLPARPLEWADQSARDEEARRLLVALTEIGRTSRGAMIGGTSIGLDAREIHLLRLAWDAAPEPPPDAAAAQRDWLSACFDHIYVGGGIAVIGVKLRRQVTLRKSTVTANLSAVLGEFRRDAPDLRTYAADRAKIASILGRLGCRAPTDDESMRLEWWWNGGSPHQALLYVEPDGRSISSDAWPEGLEMSALVRAQELRLNRQRGLWLAQAFGHFDGCVAFSFRGELWPPRQVRDLMRRAQRKAIARLSEQAETGDLMREEDSDLLALSEELEHAFRQAEDPLLRNCALLFAKRAAGAGGLEVEDTFRDQLDAAWGLDVKPVQARQMECLEEMLPCAKSRLGSRKPFAQDMTAGVICASGLTSRVQFGDPDGVWIGLAPPDMTPVYIDPKGPSKSNLPPAMAVVGEPGAGKTFLLQMIATQARQRGEAVIMINPKPADSLQPFAHAVGGEIITLSSLAKEPGTLDPFRFAPPIAAANVAADHILAILAELPQDEAVQVTAGLSLAAEAGARSVGEAVSMACGQTPGLPSPPLPVKVADMIRWACAGNPLAALGMADAPRPPLGLIENQQGGSLTLIEFDRPLQLPSSIGAMRDLEVPVRSAVAALRLVCRAALEQLLAGDGGVLIVDEAHVFMSSSAGRQVIQRLGREGRSQQIFPVLATQRIADLLSEGTEMGSYLSRVIAMRMTDERETTAVLNLLKLEATPARRAWLADAGPKREEGRAALALHSDLEGRCAAVLIGPVPQEVHDTFSTNPLDRKKRDQAAAPEAQAA